MAEGNFVQAAIPKFDGVYWSLVEEGVAAAPIGASQEQLKIHEESKLKDLKAKNYLFQAIDRSIIETILDKSSGKGHLGLYEAEISRTHKGLKGLNCRL
ncbi:retrovirus-related Pol polyprotein from transposon TNT 1-94 [Sesbania bispinosa]|nr:retrovirus-related Pol polyprotein from transposon TNT 1-94 [Sesbania bispinosa]